MRVRGERAGRAAHFGEKREPRCNDEEGSVDERAGGTGRRGGQSGAGALSSADKCGPRSRSEHSREKREQGENERRESLISPAVSFTSGPQVPANGRISPLPIRPTLLLFACGQRAGRISQFHIPQSPIYSRRCVLCNST